MTYTAPIADILLSLNHGAGLKAAVEAGHYGDFDGDITAAVLEEAGKFASDVLAPLNRVGDEHGIKLEDGQGHDARRAGRMPISAGRAAGWNALSGPEAFGGQGLPLAINAACIGNLESAANMAFGLGPLLTLAAIEALDAHGSDELKQIYLRQARVAANGPAPCTSPSRRPAPTSARCARAPSARRDGTYRISGTKIFITYGEHDLTDNIVHLVLARLPDAPAGTRGHLAVPGAEIPRQRRRLAGRAQRRPCLRRRAQARHPRLADLHHDYGRRTAARSAT